MKIFCDSGRCIPGQGEKKMSFTFKNATGHEVRNLREILTFGDTVPIKGFLFSSPYIKMLPNHSQIRFLKLKSVLTFENGSWTTRKKPLGIPRELIVGFLCHVSWTEKKNDEEKFYMTENHLKNPPVALDSNSRKVVFTLPFQKNQLIWS